MANPVAGLAAATVGSSVVGARSAGKAADAAERSKNEEIRFQREVYNETRERLEPYGEENTNAMAAWLSEMGLGEAPEGYGGYSQSPMAKYLLEEGTDSVNEAFASRGGYNSGAALEALEGNRRAVIEADTDKYLDRLYSTAGMGFDAAQGVGSAGRYFASAAGAASRNAANVQGQAYMAQGDAIRGGIEDAAGIYGYYSNPMAAYAAPTMRAG